MGFLTFEARYRSNGTGHRWRLAWLSASIACATIAGTPSNTFAQETARYSIPAGSLDDALTRFGTTSGVQVLYSSSVTQGLRSSGVSGNLSPQAALGELLSGTGLSFRFTGPNSATIGTPAQVAGASANATTTLAPIVIKGDRLNVVLGDPPPAYAGGQVATGGQLGLLGNRDVMDTPFNATSYTAETLENQQSRSIADVTKNAPSVRTTWADGSYSNQFFVRGFPLANPDISIGGLYGLVPYQMSGTSWVDRVEVLKGPNALLSGMPPQGSVGGAINLVPKRATDEPITRITGNYVSEGQVGRKIDIGRRFGDGDEIGVRVNGSYINGNAPVDGQANELGEASIGLDYQGDRLRLSADLVYQKNYSDNPARPIFVRPGFKVPDAPDASSDLGQDWYFSDGKDVLGIVRGEFDITDGITAYASLGARHNDFLGLYNFSYLKNAAGDFDANNYYQPTYNDSVTGEVGVRTNFETGPIRHQLNIGFTGLYNELGALAQVVSTYSSNIYNPGSAPYPVLSGFRSEAPKTSAITLTSFAVTDSLYMLDDRLQLIVGARHQKVRQKAWNGTTGVQTPDYDESAITPAVGLIVKPWENVSLYANYVEGLSQGPIAPAGSANAGEAFAPMKSKQYEAGVKVDLGRVTATASVFQIEQPSGFLDAVTNTYGINGETRNRGLEFNVFGELADDIRVLGGVTFMDGIQKKTVGGATDGKTAVGIPDLQLNLGAEWDTPFLEGLTLTGRVIHTSSQYVSNDNSQEIPHWTRLDLGARYVFEREYGKPVTIRASVENVLDKSYWAAASSNFGLARGAPRTFLLSTTFDF